MEARLLIDSAAAGAWNMAVDEVLLDSAAKHGQVTLRVYGWAEPTVSLGYFQRVAERTGHSASLGCPIVRRTTGGGAIVHDRELTYSLARPEPRSTRGASAELYSAVHETLVAELAVWGVSAGLVRAADSTTDHPWLCFQRRTEGDIVLGSFKIGGSAQRRLAGGLLQHGSLLLAQSPRAPELPGIDELAGQRIAADQFVPGWIERLGRRLGTQFRQESLSDVETQEASWIQSSRFTSHAWTEKR